MSGATGKHAGWVKIDYKQVDVLNMFILSHVEWWFALYVLEVGYTTHIVADWVQTLTLILFEFKVVLYLIKEKIMHIFFIHYPHY